MDDAHTKTTDEVVFYFKTDETSGLSDDQVKQSQEKYGPNGKSLIFYLAMSLVVPEFV